MYLWEMSAAGSPHRVPPFECTKNESRSLKAHHTVSQWAQIAATTVCSFCRPLSTFPDCAMKVSGSTVKGNGGCSTGANRTWRDTFFNLAPSHGKLLVEWCFPNSLVVFIFCAAFPICLQWDADIATQVFLLSLCTVIWAGIIIYHWWSTDVLEKGSTACSSVSKRTTADCVRRGAGDASQERTQSNCYSSDIVRLPTDNKQLNISNECTDEVVTDIHVGSQRRHGDSQYGSHSVTQQDESCGSTEGSVGAGNVIREDCSQIVEECSKQLPCTSTVACSSTGQPISSPCPTVVDRQEPLPCSGDETKPLESVNEGTVRDVCKDVPHESVDKLIRVPCTHPRPEAPLEEDVPLTEDVVQESKEEFDKCRESISDDGNCIAGRGSTPNSCTASLDSVSLRGTDMLVDYVNGPSPSESSCHLAFPCSSDDLGFEHLGSLISSSVSEPGLFTCAELPREIEASGGVQATDSLSEVLCDVSNDDLESPCGTFGQCVESKFFDISIGMCGTAFSKPLSSALESDSQKRVHETLREAPCIESYDIAWNDSLASSDVVCSPLLSVPYLPLEAVGSLTTGPASQVDARLQQHDCPVRVGSPLLLNEGTGLPTLASSGVPYVGLELSIPACQHPKETDHRGGADLHGCKNRVESVKFAKSGKKKTVQKGSVGHKQQQQRKCPGSQGFKHDSRAILQYYMGIVSKCRRRRDCEGAFKVLDDIRKEGKVVPDAQLLNYVLYVCVEAQNTPLTNHLFEYMEREGVADIVTYNTILKGYSSARELDDAEKLFDRMEARNIVPDVVTYNLMVNTAVSAGKIEKAWDYVDRMKDADMVPDKCTVSSLIKSLQVGLSQEHVQRALDLMDNADVCEDSILLSTCIDAISRLGDRARLEQLLKKFEVSSPVLKPHAYGTLIKAYGRLGKLEKVKGLWDELQRRPETEPSDYTYGCVLECLLTNRCVDEAANFFLDMVDKGVADAVHFSILVKGLTKHGLKGVDKALEAYSRVCGVAASYPLANMNCHVPQHRIRFDVTDSKKQYKKALNTVSLNGLLQLCVKNGRVNEALKIFRDMELLPGVAPDVVSYSTLIKGLCCSPGDAPLGHALDLLKRMLDLQITPDAILFNTLIQGAATRKNVHMVENLLKLMCSANVKPSSYTLCQCIKLYGKCNNLPQALALAESLPAQFNFAIDGYVYTALITACISNNECALAARFALKAYEAGCDLQPEVIKRLKVAMRQSNNSQFGEEELEEFGRLWNLPRSHGRNSESLRYAEARGKRSRQRRGGDLMIRRAGCIGLT